MGNWTVKGSVIPIIFCFVGERITNIQLWNYMSDWIFLFGWTILNHKLSKSLRVYVESRFVIEMNGKSVNQYIPFP